MPTPMGRFVITVEFEIHDEVMAQFMPLMLDNAERSRTLEPGCERFDVLVPATAGNRVFLYEIYRDRAAFEAHLNTPHFLEFAQKTKPMIKGRVLGEYFIENDDGK
jgi:quinol monooxygenase YgiN